VVPSAGGHGDVYRREGAVKVERFGNQPAPSNVVPISGGAPTNSGKGLRPTTAEKALSVNQLAYLDWLTGGRAEGESQGEFAASIGVESYVLSKWKRNFTFLTAWEQRMLRVHAHPQILSEQLETIRDIVKHGKNQSDRLKAAELYWKLLEKMAPGGVIVRPPAVEDKAVGELTDEELAALLADDEAVA
jgi:DNA-binding transcriptional regulator YiaG